jgi:hypothetical protein
VNRPGGTKKEALSFGERTPAEQASEARERRIRHEAPLAGNAAVRVFDSYLH